jgi:hypothetical protein
MASEKGVLLQHAFKAFLACHNAVSNIVRKVLIFFSVSACPRSCTCSEKVKLANCANGGFTHLPRGVRGNGHYIILLMNDNQITTLTEKDMTELQGFKEIDMRT